MPEGPPALAPAVQPPPPGVHAPQKPPVQVASVPMQTQEPPLGPAASEAPPA
jgi:hypothetical protein